MNRVTTAACKGRADKGMALVSVLMVTVVMLGLAGAFFAAHKSDLALMTSGTYREQTKNACLSVADFIQYKLQNDRKFAMGAFSQAGDFPKPEVFPDNSPTPNLKVSYVGKRSGPTSPVRNFLQGSLPDSDVDFDAQIINNIDGVHWAGTGDKITPPRTVRVWVTTRRGNITQNLDFILKRSPFTNASIVSGKDISVQLTDSKNGAWWLGARQPSGNSVRASGTITGPEVLSSTSKAVEFSPPEGLDLEPPYGVLQAQNLNMQLNGVATNLEAGQETIKKAEENIDGVLSPGGGTVLVPDLKREDLQAATDKLVLRQSNLVFTTRKDADNNPVHVLQDGNGNTIASYNPALDPSMETRKYNFPDTPLEGSVSIDLENRVMRVQPNVELQTEGRKFVLRSVDAKGNPDTARQPTLFLGSNQQGSAIDASSIDIQGSVGGMGALKSEEDLTIAAKSYLSTTPDFGVALHAQRDVVLTKPGTSANDGLAVDWDAFGQGYGKSPGDLDKWAVMTANQRLASAAQFKSSQLASSEKPESFDEIWSGLTKDLPADVTARNARDEWLKKGVDEVRGPQPGYVAPVPPPGEPPEPAPIVVLTPAVPAGPGIDVDKYVRLREYLRTVKAGAADPSWLSSDDNDVNAQRRDDVTNLVNNQLSAYQLAAGQKSREEGGGQVILEWRQFNEYFVGSNPYKASYTPDMVFRGLIYAGRDFLFNTEKQGIYVEGALVAKGDVRISNATGARFVYNSELLENLFATDEEDTSVPLERAYWAYY